MPITFKKINWWIFSALCIIVGLYPIIYFLVDGPFGLLLSKNQELLSNMFWNIGFYGHIVPGGLALLIGWTQFSKKLRRNRLQLHRSIGKTYLTAVAISGLCGIFIAHYATGGMSNMIGFSLSGIVWMATTGIAFLAIRKGNIETHQDFMTYSYAVCFSAVTLRVWLPILIIFTGDFDSAYPYVGWLSWVPNLLVAQYIISRRKKNPATKIA